MKRSEFLKILGLGALATTVPIGLFPKREPYFDVNKLKDAKEKALKEFRLERERAYLYKPYNHTLETMMEHFHDRRNRDMELWEGEVWKEKDNLL